MAKKKAASATGNGQIELENIAAIDHLSIPVQPGVTVLLGTNGAGKSSALEAVADVLRGSGKPSVTASDGADQGIVDVFGATLRVGRSSRRVGELAVESIEGRFDLSDLANPGRKDAASGDSVAIKALVSLSGVKADASRFAALLPAEFSAVVSSEALNTDDPVEMASRVKRQFEAAARKDEQAAEHLRNQAEALERLIADVPEGESDASVLMARLEAALAANSELEAADNAADMALGRTTRARATLEEIDAKEKAAGIKTPAECWEQVERAAVLRGQALDGVAKAREELLKAEDTLRQMQTIESAARERHTEAEARSAARKAAEAAIAQAGAATRPDPAEMEAAAQELAAAREANNAGVRIREAQAKKKEVAKLREAAGKQEKHAAELRDAAAATDDVLTELVKSKVLKVKSIDGLPRLVLATKRGPHTFYRQLSDGERYKTGIDAALENLPPGGLLVLRQTAWQDLAPAIRREVHEYAKSKGVFILTALVADGPLRVETMGEQ